MISPRGHLGHVREGLLFRVGAAGARLFLELPLHHALEALVEWLQLALLVDAVSAIGARFDGHAAAFAGMVHFIRPFGLGDRRQTERARRGLAKGSFG